MILLNMKEYKIYVLFVICKFICNKINILNWARNKQNCNDCYNLQK